MYDAAETLREVFNELRQRAEADGKEKEGKLHSSKDEKLHSAEEIFNWAFGN